MDGLFSLLLFAGLFFLMMRFGCGAHVMHGGHGHDHSAPGAMDGNGVDPVCGMQVPANKGYTKVHRGTLFHFCSRSCLDKFEADPEQYISNGKESS